jgi:hypothetical protein
MKSYLPSMRSLVVLLAVLIASPPLGCNRAQYRQKADQEALALVNHASRQIDRPMSERFSIQPSADSRFHDPYDPDRPPMPEDDPVSHRLMHEVDGMAGSKAWAEYGRTREVENPRWRNFLTMGPNGIVELNRDSSMKMALTHSVEYQEAREALYLAALNVAEQRFHFDMKYSGGTSLLYDSFGHPKTSSTTTKDHFGVPTPFGFSHQFATGATLAVDFLNTFAWEFAGGDVSMAKSTLDVTFIQPLLRNAGRGIILENLTESERALLGSIRQYERYRRGFYANIVTGGGNVGAPSSGGPGLGGSASAGGLSAGGYLGLLEQQAQISNLEFNIKELQESTDRLAEMFRLNSVDRIQVEQTRQRLLSSQNDLLSLNNSYQSRLDTFKMTLGLPPDLDVEINDPILSDFILIDPELTRLQDDLEDLLIILRSSSNVIPSNFLTQMDDILVGLDLPLQNVLLDLEKLANAIPERERALILLQDHPAVRDNEGAKDVIGVDVFRTRVEGLNDKIPTTVAQIRAMIEELSQSTAGKDDPNITLEHLEVMRRPIKDSADVLATQLMTLAVYQAQARCDIQVLVPIKMTPERALSIAEENRRDWMNARAELVDRWRKIEIAANELESDLGVKFDGGIDTVGKNPLDFDSSTSTMSMSFVFDAPLTRLMERNGYRETLISFQQAKRSFYRYQDQINAALRSTLRTIEQNQLGFELDRAAVLVAIAKLDQAQMTLKEPLPPGKSSIDDTVAINLTNALQTLLSAQNKFLSTWVDYQAQRVSLDLDLGTMEVDPYGIWLDPGTILEVNGVGLESTPEFPMLDPLSVLPTPPVVSEPIVEPSFVPTLPSVPVLPPGPNPTLTPPTPTPEEPTLPAIPDLDASQPLMTRPLPSVAPPVPAPAPTENRSASSNRVEAASSNLVDGGVAFSNVVTANVLEQISPKAVLIEDQPYGEATIGNSQEIRSNAPSAPLPSMNF